MAYEYKFNLPGPDISGNRTGALLNRVPASRQLVVNMTSCQRRRHRVSAQAQPHGDRRHQERHREERHRIRALLGGSAARSGRRHRQERIVSALEAFRYADKKTAAFYECRSGWPPSTPCWKTPARATACARRRRRMAKGMLAAQFPLLRIGAAAAAANDPAKLQLLAKKEAVGTADRQAQVRESRHAAGRVQEAARRAVAGIGEDAGGDRQMRLARSPCLCAAVGRAAGANPGAGGIALETAPLRRGERCVSKRWWRRIRGTPNTASAGAGCFWSAFNRTDAAKLFNEALAIEPKKADALLGLALVAADGFEAQGRRVRAQGAGSRSAAVGSAGTDGAPGARRQRSRRRPPKRPTRPWRFAERHAGQSHLATIDWLNDKRNALGSAQRRGVRNRRPASSS